jgi:hypothetical protein
VKKIAPVVALLCVLGFTLAARTDKTSALGATEASAASGAVSVEFAQVPLYFVENRGQHAAEALFSAAPPGYTLWMTKSGLVFDSSRKTAAGEREGAEFSRSVSRLKFVGASAEVRVEAIEPDACRVSYFKGNSPAGWVKDVPTSRAVRYSGIYPATDLKVYGTSSAVEYDWIVSPGGDPGLIRFKYEASGGVRLSAGGDLVVSTSFGDLVHHKPVCYQEISGVRLPVSASFQALGEGVFGFELSAYDHSIPLVIDPVVLVASTYIGGADRDAVLAVTADARGAIYATGHTLSSDFPALKGYDMKLSDDYDAVVLKFAPDGKTLVFSTYFGGKGYERGNDIVIDRKRTIWVVGGTESDDYPTKNAVDDTANGDQDGFLARFNPLGNALLYSTYLGGGQTDTARSLGVGSDFSVVVSGSTQSKNFPVKDAFQEELGGVKDAFLVKYAAGAKSILYATYLGGTGEDLAYSVALGSDSAAYLGGYSMSSDFPVKNPYDSTRSGSSDAIAAKFDSKGALVYSTYIGGADLDKAMRIVVDSKGAAYLTGYTVSKNFPTKNAYDDSHNGYYDIFILKLAPSGKSLEFSTYLGGSHYDTAYGMALDASGAVWIGGITDSPGFPLKDPIDSTLGGNGKTDGFVARISKTRAKLEFSTFLGGQGAETLNDLAGSADGTVVAGGYTDSTDFPVLNPYDGTFNGGIDCFITKFKSSTAAARKR